MTGPRLVTDEQAENIRAVLDMGGLINAHGYELLDTRAALIGALEPLKYLGPAKDAQRARALLAEPHGEKP